MSPFSLRQFTSNYYCRTVFFVDYAPACIQVIRKEIKIMYTLALTLTLTVGIIAAVLIVAKSYFSMKNEIKNYKRFEEQVGVLLDALDKKLPQSKVIELKNYVRKVTA
jgi:hypothetical protein